MNDVDRWIYFDGPEPEGIRPLLDALRDLPPATPEDRERMARRFFERLDAALSRREEHPGTEETPPTHVIDESPERNDALAAPGKAWPPHEQGTAEPEVPRAPEDLTGTESTLEVPAAILKAVGRMPFKPALPFAGNTVGAGIVPFPRLSFEQYASLQAELAVWAEGARNILLRYHVLTEAARGALEEHWQTQLAADPGERAAFERAVAEYTACLRRVPS